MAQPDLTLLEATIPHRFADPRLLREAMTHSSYRAEHANVEWDNQRLEFLGDAVLQLIATRLLFLRYPDAEEGPLTRMRSLLTSEPTLVRFACNLKLGEFLLLGKGERHCGGGERASTLADAFEALVAALYLDGGMLAAEPLVERLIAEAIPDPREALAIENPKGRLQELVQAARNETPVYEVQGVTGPEHDPVFAVAVKIGGEVVATAQASNRRQAEKEAARAALLRLGPDAGLPPAAASA